jgi:uncharacterized protein
MKMNSAAGKRGFTHARWQYLLFFNYAVDPDLLIPLVPTGTELDIRDGSAWMSLVGLTFKETRALGIPIPFQQDYEQINLRFYVTRHEGGHTRKGVVFLREIVSKPGLSLMARWLLNEKYVPRPTKRKLRLDGHFIHVDYGWKTGEAWNEMVATATDRFEFPEVGSEQAFFSHRLWMYTEQRDGKTAELSVRHPLWQSSDVTAPTLKLEDPDIFGPTFGPLLRRAPDSAFLAEGSPVTVRTFDRLDETELQEHLLASGM